MTIGKKLLIATISLVLLAFMITLVFSLLLFKSSFSNLERENLASNVTRASNALTISTGKLTLDAQDLAFWDDTYKFAQIGNVAYGNTNYINLNFSDKILENKNVNLIVIIDRSDQIVHGVSYDTGTHQEITMSQAVKSFVRSAAISQNGVNAAGISGLADVGGTLMLISAQPILTSGFQGPSAGTIVFGTIVDNTFISQLSQTTQTDISIWQENNTQVPPDVKTAKAMLSAPGSDFTQPLDSKYAAGYTLIDDVFGNPSVILKTTVSRDLFNQGRAAIIFMFVILGLASILFGLMFVFIMRRTILARFDALALAVSDIGKTGDVSKPVTLPLPWIRGNDEISDLQRNINDMLSKIGETESKLIKQKNLFERLLLYNPAIILVVDGNLNITLMNKAFCTMFNVKEEDTIGKPLSLFFPQDELEASGKQISDVEGSVTIFEHRPKIGKTEKILDTTIITVNHNEYLLIGRDITLEREEQEKLYLNDRLASVGEMAAGLAHELNNPLTGIVMLSQLLMQTDFPPEVKKDLTDINSEASRATDVVRNLLAFARKQPPAKRLTQINKTVNDVLRLRHYEETVNNITVITTLDPDLPEIWVDNIQIQQVFLNLILNAEYSMINTHKKGVLEVDTSVNNGKVVISFTDDGAGIKEEDMRKLFQPFFTTKQVGVGTGLGLSLCYGIVTRHGGNIYARSKYGSGVTFVVELPIDMPKTVGDDINSKKSG